MLYLCFMKNKKPFVIILSGVPMSGKSTWIKNNYPDTLVVSRDNILLEVAKTEDYGYAYKTANHKKVDKMLLNQIITVSNDNKDVIIDMTNLTRKVRMRNLSYFSDKFYKKAVAFSLLDVEEYEKRNNFRKVNENKYIPMGVLHSMISNYVLPTLDEGFDDITII